MKNSPILRFQLTIDCFNSQVWKFELQIWGGLEFAILNLDLIGKQVLNYSLNFSLPLGTGSWISSTWLVSNGA